VDVDFHIFQRRAEYIPVSSGETIKKIKKLIPIAVQLIYYIVALQQYIMPRIYYEHNVSRSHIVYDLVSCRITRAAISSPLFAGYFRDVYKKNNNNIFIIPLQILALAVFRSGE